MAIYLTAASSQYLRNATAYIPDYPFTIGIWCNLAAVGTVIRSLISISDTGTTNNNLRLRMSALEVLQVVTVDTAQAETAAGVTIPFTPGEWSFALCRFVTALERRLAFFSGRSGTVIQYTNANLSRTPTSMDCITIGALETSAGPSLYWDGALAEYWIANRDVGRATSNLPTEMVMQLALGGPFSVPHIADSIIEYRSFRQGAASDSDRIGDVYHGRERQVWTAVNGPIQLAPHPPLPYWYKRPGQTRRALVI